MHRVRSGEFDRSKGAAASPQPTDLRRIIAVGERHQLNVLTVRGVQHYSISDEGFGVTNKARVVEIFSAGVALFVPMNLAWGQSCQCENTPVVGLQPIAGFHHTPPGNGDSPVVPEPGNIILPGIAGGVGGAGLIRRRLKKVKADGK